MKTWSNLLLFTVLFCVLSIRGAAQFVLKINASNTIDSIAYLRTNLFDEKNYIPKDTIKIYKSTITIKNTKSIVGGIYYLYFPKSKQKIQFILEDQDTVRLIINGKDYLENSTINLNKNMVLLAYQRLEKSLSHYDSSYALALKSGKKFNQIQKAAYFKVKTDSLMAYRTTALKRFKKQDAIHIYFSTLNALDKTIPSKRDYVGRHNFLKQFELNEPKLFFTPVMRQIIVEYLSYDYVELHHPFDQVYIIQKDLPNFYKLIETVKRIKNKKIVIVSAADCNGSLEYNEDLSTRRANRIYRTLSKLSNNEVVIQNVGERELLKDCSDAKKDIAAQVVNRYSYIFIIDKK